jgi:hypothetical protein
MRTSVTIDPDVQALLRKANKREVKRYETSFKAEKDAPH